MKQFFTRDEDKFIWRNKDDMLSIQKVLPDRDKYEIHRRIETLEDLVVIYGCSFEQFPVKTIRGTPYTVMPKTRNRDIAALIADYQSLPIMDVVKKHTITRNSLKYNVSAFKPQKEAPKEEGIKEVFPKVLFPKVIQRPLIHPVEEPDDITLLIGIKNNQQEIIKLLEDIRLSMKTSAECLKYGDMLWRAAEGRRLEQQRVSFIRKEVNQHESKQV